METRNNRAEERRRGEQLISPRAAHGQSVSPAWIVLPKVFNQCATEEERARLVALTVWTLERGFLVTEGDERAPPQVRTG